jgi:hypothetical protein
MRRISFLLMMALCVPVLAGGFAIDPKIPALPIDDDTELTVLNARFGSRFSLSPVFRDKGVYQGAMGYDQDEFSELLIEVETASGAYCFRTASLPANTKYLENQTVRVGLTGIELLGYTSQGLKITATIVSPFTPSGDLDDVEHVKMQIAPAFIVLVHVESKSKEPRDIAVRVGLRKVMIQYTNTFGARIWYYGADTDKLIYRDNASYKTRQILQAISEGSHTHAGKQGFNCLQKQGTVARSKVFSDTLVFASYYDEKVVNDNKYNTPLRFYYTKYWSSVDEVLDYAIKNVKTLLEKSQQFETLLTRSDRSPEEKWLAAIAFRSDVANSYLLLDGNDRERFLLSEGRFRHLNTVDVAHETELMAIFAPYRLRIQLETWLDYIARKEVDRGLTIYDEPHSEGMSASEYGPFVYHDIGNLPNVSETSDYWFGPHMAVEENCNYALLLYWYWKITGDDEYVMSNLGMLDILLYSVMNRDTDGNGIVDKGMGWSTYDNADAIKRSPENVYLGMKQFAAYLVAAEMFEKLAIREGDEVIEDVEGVVDGSGVGYREARLDNEALRMRQAKKYREEAQLIAKSLQEAYDTYGYLPCSLEESFPGWNQYSIVLTEALFLPGLSGFQSEIIDEMLPVFQSNYEQALERSRADYGIKMSSEEEGTWFSKIMTNDVVAMYWFDKDYSSAHYAYEWNKNNFYAYNDGIDHTGNTAWIGFWYPRGGAVFGYFFKEKGFTGAEAGSFLQGLR